MHKSMEIIYATPKDSDLDSITLLLKSERGDLTNIELNRLIIARDGSDIVGCVRTKDLPNGCVELASLVVSPNYRGQGIGIKLVNEVLIKDTRRPIYLLCMNDKENFYRKASFSLIQINELPDVLQNEYNRVAEKLPEIKNKIIAMVIND